MLQNHLAYDPAELRTRCVQRHGSVLGEIVYDAQLKLRQLQDARAADLGTELTALHAEMNALLLIDGERRAKSKARLEAAYSVYLALCDEDAKADSVAQAQIAPLTARSLDIQEQVRNISQPRISDRELSALALYASADAERLRSVDKRLPPLNTPQSELARVNMSVGLQRP